MKVGLLGFARGTIPKGLLEEVDPEAAISVETCVCSTKVEEVEDLSES